MAKTKKIMIIIVLSILGVFIEIEVVHADSTVLYTDGTLIINEKDSDRDSNLEKHGEYYKEYKPLSDENKYKFTTYNEVLWYKEDEKIKKVELGQKISPTSTAYWFASIDNLSDIDLTNLDGSNLVNMRNMFAHSGNSTNVQSFTITGLSDLNVSKVTNMSGMFESSGVFAYSYNIGDLTNWDTSKVTSMERMFKESVEYGKMLSYNNYTSNFSSIGTLKIPANCNIDYLADNSPFFKGNFILKGTPSSYDDAFNKLNSKSDVTLFYSNSNTKNVVNKLISYFGPNGIYSKGNIKKKSTYTYSVEVIVNGGTSDKDSKTINDEENVEFNITPEKGYINPIASCTNNQKATVEDNILTLNEVTADTTCTVDYEYEKRVTDIILDKDSYTYTGKEIEPIITLKNYDVVLELDTDYTIEYSNNVNVGAGKIIIKYKNDYFGKEEIVFDIVPANIENYEVKGIVDKEYTGSVITQDIEVYNENKKLTTDDYDIDYDKNTNLGIATVTIEGKGNYTGTITKTFKIISNDINNYQINGVENKIYTGTTITQDIEVYNGFENLTTDDYSISYEKNIDVGIATITIIGKGSCTGKKVIFFKINPASIKNYEVRGIVNKDYTGTYITQDIEVYNDSKKLSRNDYKVTYNNNVNAGTATILIEGENNYTGKIEKTFNINKLSINNYKVLGIKDEYYTGNPITQNIELYSGDKKLTKDDYYIEYVSNIDAGYGNFKIIGKGNYTGIIYERFNIFSRKLTSKNTKIIGIKNKVYNGKTQNQLIKLIYNNKVLEEGKDFSYLNTMGGKDIGIATIDIINSNNFPGPIPNYEINITVPYRINPGKVVIKKIKSSRKKLNISYKKLPGNVKYLIAYKKKGTKKWKYKKTSKTTITINKLKSKKKYEIKVQAYKYIPNSSYYSYEDSKFYKVNSTFSGDWSSIKTQKVK